MAKSELKVLTYNVFHDLPAYRQLEQRLRLIASEIAAERPHVIAIQEVVRASRGDTGAMLCAMANERCGNRLYRLDYARADGIGEGESAFEDGIALMSRLEPAGAPQFLKFDAQVRLGAELGGHRYRLPDDRVAMMARYRLNNGIELQACVTHLTDRVEAADDGVPVRLMQAGELVRWIRSAGGARHPVLLAGDFNDVPDSQTIATIIGAGFTDLWRVAGDGPGYTNDRSDLDLESPHGAPNQRIDYLFFRAGGGRDFEITDARLFLDRPRRKDDGGWLWGSDHVGVMATLGI